MRRTILATLVLAACTKSDPQRTPHDGVAPRDAGANTMASVSLKLVTDVTGQPSDAVAWSADGIVTADLKRVVRWVGDQPGTPIAYSTPGYGVPRSISLLPDGVVGVGALRIARDGTTIVDNAKLAAALVSGDLIAKDSLADPRDYRVGSAAWTSDASQLWLGIEQRKAGSRDAPIEMTGPTYRNLVVDAQLATPQEPQEQMAWSTILAAGEAVVTVAGNLVSWPDGAGGTRHELATSPPLAVGMDPAGTMIAAATSSGARAWEVAGTARTSWTATGIVGAIAVAPGAAWIATGSTATTSAGLLQLWRLDGDQAELAAELGLPEVPIAMAFSPDGTRLVIGAMAQHVLVVTIDR